MSLEASAALLGHRSMDITLTYVAHRRPHRRDEYFAVSEKGVKECFSQVDFRTHFRAEGLAQPTGAYNTENNEKHQRARE